MNKVWHIGYNDAKNNIDPIDIVDAMAENVAMEYMAGYNACLNEQAGQFACYFEE